MKSQVLSIEQMRELIDMGIDVSKASMCWIIYEDGDYEVGTEDLAATLSLDYTIEKTTPAFTLQDILTFFNSYQILKLSDGVTLGIRFNEKWVHSEFGDNLLSIAFNMLKWCKENEYI